MEIHRLALIGVEVQLQPIVGGYAHKDIAKQYSSSMAFIRYFNAILVFESKSISIERAHMEMAQSTDNAAFKLDPRSGSLNENTRRPRQITRRANWSVDAQRDGICLR